MSHRTARLASLVVLFTALACSDNGIAPTPPVVVPQRADVSGIASPWAEVVDGETGPNSSYRLYMPSEWNGELVVYAHGIMAPFRTVAQGPEAPGYAAIFGAQHFAVAMSSYDETGIAIKDGVQRTHQLRGLFASRFGKPSRTYLVGSSMGGFIVAALAEQYPKQYDGVLPLCGVVGGFKAEFDYVLSARVLFDAVYPHVLPGSASAVDMPSDSAAATAAVIALQRRAGFAIGTDTRPVSGAVQIALTDQSRMPLPPAVTPQQFGAFVVTPLVLHAVFLSDIVQHTQGHMPITNVGTTYSSPVPLMANFLPDINARVEQVASTRDAENWLQHNGETTGRISIPTLTLHTRYDTWVPQWHEAIYKSRVVAAGQDDLLVQRTTDGFDHCNFKPAEIGKGLTDLVAWVEQGVKPAP